MDTLVNAVCGFAAKELFSIVGRDVRDRLDIVPELEKLRKKLLQVRALLMDAERRYTEPGVNILRDDLRDLLYDMDDIIDEVKIQGLKEVARNQDQVRRLFSDASNKLKKVKELWSDGEFNKAIRQKINKVLANFEEVKKDADGLGLRGNSSGLTGGVSQTRLRPETSPSVDESEVYGRGKDKESLIELLFATARDENKKNYSVICIVGMGGVGKTTLAQLVFNDVRVKPKFNMLSWACVSDVFDVAKVTKDLIEYSTNENNCSDMSLAALQKRLEKEVRGKRFFLVLDDIWISKEWDCMKAPLNHCSKGSIILVTTRDKAIANAISNTPPYELETLDDGQCWSLFKDKAFRDVDGNADEHLLKLGKQIVEKCKGVPLAVKVLGAMLQGAEPERWRAVLKTELWSLKNGEMFLDLRVSYHYLPSPLKCCFEYFSLFPTDYKFDEEKLVLMWVGEGFIEAEENRQLEDIGRQYFNDLKRRCLVQNNNQIHDLVHSLACDVSGDFYCRLSSDGRSRKSLKRARHASLLGNVEETDIRILDEAKGLHTILQFGYFAHGLMDKLSEWRFLRVVKLGDIPEDIGDLRSLRHLDLSSANISGLPQSICKLDNLQVLNLGDCCQLTHLPEDIGDLRSLRHLDLSSVEILSLPQSICKLDNLQVLNLGSCWQLTQLPQDIGDLRSLRHLDLLLAKISSLPQSICKLDNLQVLNLEQCYQLTCLPEDIGDLRSLRHLDLSYLNISSLPQSICKLDNLQVLNLGSCGQLTQLPQDIGDLRSLRHLDLLLAKISSLPQSICKLDNLQVLNLEQCYQLTCLPEDIGDLRSLRHLGLSDLNISSLPQSICKLDNLQVLNIRSCEQLIDLPEDIGDLRSLRHLGLSDLNISSLPQSICKLDNLQVLNVSCRLLTYLPEDIGDLRSLMSLKLDYAKIFKLPDSIVKATNLQNIDNTWGYSELPPYFGKLTCLQHLMVYPIGKEIGRGIGELKDMNNLEGNLSISNLENVNNVEEAKLANMKSKKNISDLEFKWSALRRNASEDDNNSLEERDGELEVNVLEALEPHPSVLTSLSFENYSGERFPKWLSVMSFLSLKHLEMRRLGRVRKLVDVELPSLKSLGIHECPRLRNISMSTPKLRYFKVWGCQEVTKICLPPSIQDSNCTTSSWIELPRLASVRLQECSRLKEIYMKLPKLSFLKVDDCTELTKLTLIGNEFLEDASCTNTFRSLWIIYHENHMSLFQHYPPWKLEDGPSLTRIVIKKCEKLESLFLQQISALGKLCIMDCEQLRSLTMDGPLPPSLTKLAIVNCGKLESLFRDLSLVDPVELSIYNPSWEALSDHLGNLASIHKLKIWNFPHPTSLPEVLHNLTSLTSLAVINCPQLVSFPEDGLPPMLTELYIKDLPKLQYLPKGLYKSSLQLLSIDNCLQVEARPDDQLPSSLRKLIIICSPKLKQQLQDEGREDWLALLDEDEYEDEEDWLEDWLVKDEEDMSLDEVEDEDEDDDDDDDEDED